MVFLVKSSRGGEKLVDDSNHIYRLCRKTSDKTYWRCEVNHCKGRVHTVKEGEYMSITKSCGEHFHPANPSKPLVYEAKSLLREYATNSDVSTKSIIATVSANLDKQSLALLPNERSMSSVIRKWRRINDPPLPSIPTSRNSYIVPSEYSFFSTDENFLLFDSGVMDPERILIFGTERGIRDLVRYRIWTGDATLKCCPSIYYELFSLSAVIEQTSLPRVFGLLPSKSKEAYSRFFIALKELNKELNPESLTVDFEKPLHVAFNQVFPASKILGNIYYLSQNIFKHLSVIELKEHYQENPDFNLKVKCFTALAFLPPGDVIDGFTDLTDDDDIPQELVSYFQNNFIGAERGQGKQRRRLEPTFRIELWSNYERCLKGDVKICNVFEGGFYNSIRGKFADMPPNVWKLIEYLKKEERSAIKMMNDLEGGHLIYPQKKNKHAGAKLQLGVQEYNSKEKINYLKDISCYLHAF